MPEDLYTAPGIVSLSPLSLATEVTLGASGLWLETRTGAGCTATLAEIFLAAVHGYMDSRTNNRDEKMYSQLGVDPTPPSGSSQKLAVLCYAIPWHSCQITRGEGPPIMNRNSSSFPAREGKELLKRALCAPRVEDHKDTLISLGRGFIKMSNSQRHGWISLCIINGRREVVMYPSPLAPGLVKEVCSMHLYLFSQGC